MTVSGSFSFDPSVASFLDEAFERAGIDPATITPAHIISAKRSLNLMFTEWVAIDGDALYRDANSQSTIISGASTFTLPAGGFDILDLVMAYNGETTDQPLGRWSRQDYLSLANKTQTGRPQNFYVDVSTLNTPTVKVWPVADATCIFTYDYMRTVQTIVGISETTDVQRLWLEAVASGLAMRIAMKYNVARLPMLMPMADRSYKIARRAGSGNSQVIISGRGFGSSARTRRR
jgi:hypothetical protein